MLDTARAEVIATVAVGKRPRGLKLNPDGTRLYVAVSGIAKCPPSVSDEECADITPDAKRLFVANEDSATVSVVDVASRTVVARIKVGNEPEGVAISPDGLITEIQVGTRPWGIALSRDGRWLYTANGPADTVSIVDTDTLKVTRQIPVGRSPWGIVIGE